MKTADEPTFVLVPGAWMGLNHSGEIATSGPEFSDQSRGDPVLEIGAACSPRMPLRTAPGLSPSKPSARASESQEVTTGHTAFNQRHPVCAARPVAASPLTRARQGKGAEPHRPLASPTTEASASTSLARHEQATGRCCT